MFYYPRIGINRIPEGRGFSITFGYSFTILSFEQNKELRQKLISYKKTNDTLAFGFGPFRVLSIKDLPDWHNKVMLEEL